MSRWLGALVALTLALVGLEIVLGATAHGPLGVSAVAGAVGCVLIVVVSKALGKRWLQVAEPPDE